MSAASDARRELKALLGQLSSPEAAAIMTAADAYARAAVQDADDLAKAPSRLAVAAAEFGGRR